MSKNNQNKKRKQREKPNISSEFKFKNFVDFNETNSIYFLKIIKRQV